MIDECHLHIKVFINRSEIQEGKEGNADNSREKAIKAMLLVVFFYFA